LSDEQVLVGRKILSEESPPKAESSSLKKGLKELLQQADKDLKFEPVNVTQKWKNQDLKKRGLY
jgi:hypothetical protein